MWHNTALAAKIERHRTKEMVTEPLAEETQAQLLLLLCKIQKDGAKQQVFGAALKPGSPHHTALAGLPGVSCRAGVAGGQPGRREQSDGHVSHTSSQLQGRGTS